MNRYLMNAQAVFNYGVRNNHMTINPAAEIQFEKEKKKPSSERSMFDQQDLTKIFHSQKYTEDDFVQSYMFWLPILGLYTGCRIEELCQLFCSDIALYDGIWCFDINNNPGKRLKNVSSKRVIPLHPVLIDPLNFPGYVKKQIESGHERIFHELRKIGKGYAHAAGKWFNKRYKDSIGLVVKAGEKKTYHSFRHTFETNLKHRLVLESIVNELCGYAHQSESMKRYGKPYIPDILFKEGIMKLDFGIDLSHLKNSKWVVR
jgi:integrase